MDQTQSLVALAEEAARVEGMILRYAEEHHGEINEQLAEYLDSIESGITVKADQYKWVLDRIEAAEEQLSTYVQKYREAAASLANAREAMRDRIKTAILSLGGKSVSGRQWRFQLAATQPKLIITDEAALRENPEFLETVTEVRLRKDVIKARLLAGEVVPGASLEETLGLRTYVNKGDRR